MMLGMTLIDKTKLLLIFRAQVPGSKVDEKVQNAADEIRKTVDVVFVVLGENNPYINFLRSQAKAMQDLITSLGEAAK